MAARSLHGDGGYVGHGLHHLVSQASAGSRESELDPFLLWKAAGLTCDSDRISDCHARYQYGDVAGAGSYARVVGTIRNSDQKRVAVKIFNSSIKRHIILQDRKMLCRCCCLQCPLLPRLDASLACSAVRDRN